MPRWQGRGGVGITDNFNIQDMSTRTATHKQSQLYFLKNNKNMFRPQLNSFINVRGDLHQYNKGSCNTTDC